MNERTAASSYGPWNPGIDSRIPESLLPLATIFRSDNSFTGVEYATEMQDLTGIDRKQLAMFRPQRLVLHELMIRVMADRQEREFERLGITFRSLFGRRLQLIDCQNLFCEVDKYARVHHPEIAGRSGRSRIKQRFVPKQTQIQYWYPPKWRINHMIPSAPKGEE